LLKQIDFTLNQRFGQISGQSGRAVGFQIDTNAKMLYSFWNVMAKKLPKSPADYIAPLNINGLEGRMLHLPGPKPNSKEILLLYGHHSNLERWWGVILTLNHSAAVTMPDLPGFGGMDSFYKIGKKPTLDNMADYLAAFVKMRYKRRPVIIAGMCFGFVVATRMLQRYPELSRKVIMIVSIAGLAHHDDFRFGKVRRTSYLALTRLFRHRLPAAAFRAVCLRPGVIRTFYGRTHNAKHKFAGVDSKAEFNRLMNFEIGLWRNNDVRTLMFSSRELLRLDNCKVRVNLPVWSVVPKVDHIFDQHLIEQHLRVIFKGYHGIVTNMTAHAPTLIEDELTAAPLVPAKLRRAISRLK
jgi:pimeloyl-ACP methyl ester carboxylesterase